MYGRSLVPTRTSGCSPYGCKLVAASKSQFPAEWMRLQGRPTVEGKRPTELPFDVHGPLNLAEVCGFPPGKHVVSHRGTPSRSRL